LAGFDLPMKNTTKLDRGHRRHAFLTRDEGRIQTASSPHYGSKSVSFQPPIGFCEASDRRRKVSSPKKVFVKGIASLSYQNRGSVGCGPCQRGVH
jgi:hypothetical protein